MGAAITGRLQRGSKIAREIENLWKNEAPDYGAYSGKLIEIKEENHFFLKSFQSKKPTISEIRSYQYPPKQVESVMRATYILLGEKPADIS